MQQTKHHRYLLPVIFSFVFTGFAVAQVDSTASLSHDTTGIAQSENQEKKIKQSFIVFGEIGFNHLHVSSNTFESATKPGWTLGASYRRGGFFYWQLGARYNNAKYGLKLLTDTTHETFTVSDLDIPVTVGINLLPFVNRVLNIRLFLSGVPSFQLKVGDNNLDIKKDDINSFIFYGQAGVGLDVLFLVIETGYNYGFNDLLKDDKSNPGQVFVKLGFRF
jgi:hypothetical protein